MSSLPRLRIGLRVAALLLLVASSFAGARPAATVTRWQAGQPGSETITNSGVESRMLVAGGYAVRVYIRTTAHYDEVVLAIGNDTSHPVAFETKDVTLEVVSPGRKVLRPASPAGMVHQMREEERAIIAADKDMPAVAPQSRRQRRWLPQDDSSPLSVKAQTQIEALKEQEAYVQTQMFRSGLVPAQQILSGSIFFPPRRFSEVIVHIPIGGLEFQVPLEKR